MPQEPRRVSPPHISPSSPASPDGFHVAPEGSPASPEGSHDVPEGQLADRLHSAAIHLLRRVATVDAGSGLSPARLSPLSGIGYGGPLATSGPAAAQRGSPAPVTAPAFRPE